MKKKVLDFIQKKYNEDKKKVREVINFVIETGGIEYAQKAMHNYKDKALAILKEFEQNEANKALEELVIYTTERSK